MLRVMRNHRRAAHGEADGYERPARQPGAARSPPTCPDAGAGRRTPRAAWDRALELGEEHGYRNAQATVIAPTGTIGLVMDCDTTGIEPDFALVKFKKLAGGGYFKIINRAVPEALRTLGYSRSRDRRDRAPMRSATARSTRRPAINHGSLTAKGFTDEKIAAIEAALDARLRHQVRVQPVDARRGLLHGDARLHRRAARRLRASTCCRRSASPRARSRPPTSMSAAR